MEPIDKINKVLEDFGITGVKAAEAMGITYDTFKSKKNEKNERHSFNEKNYQDLVSFIKKQTQNLDK
ncbi:hypothetical protein D0817_20145 [Flavobacterium cupreum]|uniref:XRE family transcriptional regulator n=2 Tax=Flavobacterium cupreum TaxID=2133766 RepID=A0A434A308_9FLAO|nr:hypothetical protein [Flavobacterium sp. P3160]RUT68707.1 hypothetical protein D0817_20145 [Flavobacterium cupreum]